MEEEPYSLMATQLGVVNNPQVQVRARQGRETDQESTGPTKSFYICPVLCHGLLTQLLHRWEFWLIKVSQEDVSLPLINLFSLLMSHFILLYDSPLASGSGNLITANIISCSLQHSHHYRPQLFLQGKEWLHMNLLLSLPRHFKLFN